VEGDALHVAVTVGEDPLIEALGRCVALGRVAVGVDPQHLAAHHRRALRHLAVMGVSRGEVEEPVARAEAHAPAVVRARTAEGMVGRGHLVGHVRHDVGAVRDAGEVVVDHEPHQPVGVRGRHVRGRVDVDAPVLGEVRIDGHAHHAGLSLAEEIVFGRGKAARSAHAQKRRYLARGHQDRQALALLGEEHRPVVEERHVPWHLEVVQHDAVLQVRRVHPGAGRAGKGRRPKQSRGERGLSPWP
jgi:hypothetical protein